MSRKSHKKCKRLTNDARALISQNDLDLTYFQFLHKFLFSNHYFWILKLCGIEIGVHVEKKYFKYYVILILVPIIMITHQTVIFVSICIVAMETVAIK